jgi:putative Mn2+ efflux pump MntP
MGIKDYTLIALFIGSLVIVSPLLGMYIARVFRRLSGRSIEYAGSILMNR